MSFVVDTQDLISGGTNSCIFHTPDYSNRTTLHIAPKINNIWDWGKETEFHNDGKVFFSNNISVKGKIRAKEVKIETSWSDFVFKKEYTFPTLAEVEKHIKEKGHLKDIPSAKEVAKNGIFLGEMNAKLLQKIEELTLYTISQEKKIKNLEKRNYSAINLEIQKFHSG